MAKYQGKRTRFSKEGIIKSPNKEFRVLNNHVHFLIQSIPRMSPTQIIAIVKSITAREVFRKNPKVKEKLWGGEFWSDGYFVNTVSKFGDETSISKYIRDQGLEKEYVVLHQSKQLVLF